MKEGLWIRGLYDLGFITNPKNGEVKALSVSVP